MEADDDGFFGLPAIVLGVAAIVVIVAMLLFVPQKGMPLRDPPSVIGCYSAAGAPNIVVDGTHLRVLQQPALAVAYRLEYNKGWALSTDLWLNFSTRADGKIEIERGPDFGEFLSVSHEGQITPPNPEFQLIDRRSSLAIRYQWIGATCA